MIRILVVDDHELIRLGLEAVLAAQPDFELCGNAADGVCGVAMARAMAPDVVVMDVTMPCMDGLVATRREGKVIYYSLASEEARVILGAVYDVFGGKGRKG